MISNRPADAHKSEPGVNSIIEANPCSLIDAPLDYIIGDHFRHRSVCNALKQCTKAGWISRNEADIVVAFLAHDLHLHHEDEELSLFPALHRRALPEDNLGTVLACLSEDHHQSESTVSTILNVLSAQPECDPVELDQAACRVIQAYAASENHHLAMENGIVMAIARIRLKPADLRIISHGMQQRRKALA